MPKITLHDISASFGRNIIKLGTDYFKESRVLSCEFEDESQQLIGSIKGTADTPYLTKASIKPSNKGGYIIHSNCNCKVGWNCKHAVALLLAYQAETPNYNIENSYKTWFEILEVQLKKQKEKAKKENIISQFQGYFRLSFDKNSYNHAMKYLHVEYGSLRYLKSENSSVFSEKDIMSVLENESWMESFKWVKSEDITILQLLATKEGRTPKLLKTSLHTEHDQLALQKILATGRCFWKTLDTPLQLSEQSTLRLEWENEEEDLKRLLVDIDHCENRDDWLLIPTPTPYYLNQKTGNEFRNVKQICKLGELTYS